MTIATPARADVRRNRESLLDATIAVLRRDPDAPLATIAREAGLSRRAAYGHFPGREELVDAALERGAARIAQAVASPPDRDPLVTIARLGAALWDQVADVRAAARTAVSPAHAATVAGAMAPVRRRLRDALDRAASTSSVRTDIDVATLAPLVERAALDVLDTSDGLDPAVARTLAMTHPLCAAGVGAQRAARIAAEIEDA